MDQSIGELMGHGFGAMYVVVAFSVIALAVGIERVIAQWNFVVRARDLAEAVNKALSRGAVEAGRSAADRSPSPLADIYTVGFDKYGKAKPEHVITAVNRERLRVNTELKSRLWILGTVGATAPFVGLFGTVAGIMTALGEIDPDQTVKVGDISGPISSALIVTAAGIAVAVEAVILFNYFSQRANRIATEMKLLTDEFLELLVETPTGSSPPITRVNDAVDKDTSSTKPSKGDGDGSREAA
jgi:biopolymer transport protein ExbB/TolQ